MSASESSTPKSGSDGQPTTERRAPRLPRAEVTRQRLLEAGRELFAEYGPHEVTSQAIATRAGYASGTFYLYFKDKLALFRELAENAATELERRLQALEQDETDPYVIVKTQAEVLVGFAAEQRDLLRIAFHPGSEAAGIGSGILEHLAEGVSQRRREALAAGLAGRLFRFRRARPGHRRHVGPRSGLVGRGSVARLARRHRRDPDAFSASRKSRRGGHRMSTARSRGFSMSGAQISFHTHTS